MPDRKDVNPDPFAGSTVRAPRRSEALPTSRATQPQQRARAHVHSSSATQSIASGLDVVVVFNTVDFDTIGLFADASDRFVIPSTGKTDGCWQIHGHAQFVAAAGGTVRELKIRKNGTTIIAYSVVEINALDSLDVVVLVNDPSKGDFYELIASQDSGGPIDLTTTAEKTYFELVHLW